MASLSDPVAPGTIGVGIDCSGIEVGWGGGNPDGTLGEESGIWDALTFRISLIWATNMFKYPSDTSLRWSKDPASAGSHVTVQLSATHP